MGCLSSKLQFVDFAEGDDAAYQERYLEDRILGEGEFGVVHLVHDVRAKNPQDAEPLASKTLRKGVTFKDNTIYSPLKPEVLRRECNILRTLRGECFVLKLIGIYESATIIRIVTEYCSGGDMTEYVIKAYGKDGAAQGLRTEDVSRISYQLLSAVDHCAKHGVIHRDLKPENIMFRTPERGAELRMIDFGSSSMDTSPAAKGGQATGDTEHNDVGPTNELQEHSTFAGSAFYIAPEVFQRTYNAKADVWSAGVTLYVLVAGYPSECLQKAFNLLQKGKRDLRDLPNMPPNMPDSYFELLEELLVYRRKKRKAAADVLGSEFVRFHLDHVEEDGDDTADDGIIAAEEDDDAVGMSLDDVAKEAANSAARREGGASVRGGSTGRAANRTKSVLLEGSVQRHTLYMQYEKFERSVTTLLATVLTPGQLAGLLNKLNGIKVVQSVQPQSESALGDSSTQAGRRGSNEGSIEMISNEAKLQIIKIVDLKSILLGLNLKEAATMMSDLPNAASYSSFAYHIALLRQFVRNQEGGKGDNDLDDSIHKQVVRRIATMGNRRSTGAGGGMQKSVSGTNLARSVPASGGDGEKDAPNSVHGSNVFKDFRKKRDQRNAVIDANAHVDLSVRSAV